MRLNNVIAMKKAVAFVMLFMMGMPVFALAQSASTSESDWMGYWSRHSQYQSLIAALGDTPVATFPIPVLLGVEVSDLTQNFGDPRGNGTRTHEGLDIMAPKNTPVASPTEAVVLQTGDGADSGIYVRTANPGGEQFVYMHLTSVAKGITAGVKLMRGDVLGFVGNTGNASGGATHLHFEVRKNGATDPFVRLTQTFTTLERIQGAQQALDRAVDGGVATSLASNFKTFFAQAKAQGAAIAENLLPVIQPQTASALSTSELNQLNTGYTRDLEVGMKGEDVRKLQKYLNSNGYLLTTIGDGSPGYETLMFGALTKKALITFQKAKGISPAAGYFGPKTRAYIASH